MDRREARRQFKERKTAKGVFALRCTATGDVWVDSSRNLEASRNGQFFMLRHGSHMNRPLQRLFEAKGTGEFAFEVLETLDDETAAVLLEDKLRERRKYWLEQLGAQPV